MLQKLKANWLNILLAAIGLLSSADAVVGIRGGKSPMNITVIPSILAALGAGGTLGVRWLNGRTVVTRNVKQSLNPELWERLDNLFGLARDPDVTPDHAAHLADMAGDLLLAEHRRAKLEFAQKNQQVQVFTPTEAEIAKIMESFRRNSVNSGPVVFQETNQETAR